MINNRLIGMNKLQSVLIVSALIAGATNTLGFTLQNKQPVVEGDVHKHFFHPYMQVAMRFVSNSLSLLVYLAFMLQNKQPASQESKNKQSQNMSRFIYLIPTVLDYVAMICYYTALNFIPGSVYQILRGGTVLTTFLFSYTCLKTRPTRSKIAGCIVVLIGLIIVGVVNFMMSGGSSEQKQQTLIGYGLILIALFGNGLHFVYQQHIIVKYQVQPLLTVGMEGVFGILISLVFIPILSLIPCNLGTQICVLNGSSSSVVENAEIYWNEVMGNDLILIGVVIVIISMSIYNSVGLVIAKCMSSLTRALCDVTRTIIIWVVGIIITATLGASDPKFHWESLQPWQIVGESLGFLVLVIGNLIYYEIIKLPQQKMKRSTLIDDLESETPIIIQEQS